MKTSSPAIFLAILFSYSSSHAQKLDKDTRFSGYTQLWFRIHEQMQEAEELYQDPSGDTAATSTTGFSINRARFGASAFFIHKLVEFSTQLRMEKNFGILDLYLCIHPASWLSLYFGQFKIPAPGEALSPARKLDFILRSTISENIVDFSLSRTTYPSSLFFGIHSYLRDFGLALKGEFDIEIGTARYFLMMGNGLGANLFIGGGAKKEYILTNAGQLFSGLRLEIADIIDMISIGAHLNYNYHDNMVFNSGRAVFDLKRISYSGDLAMTLPDSGLRAACMYGRGEIRDDYDDDGKTDLIYDGWECHLLWQISDPMSRWMPSGFWKNNSFEIGVRFDNYSSDWNETGVLATQDRWTFSASYEFSNILKVQLNYMLNHIDDPAKIDLADDIILLSVQGSI